MPLGGSDGGEVAAIGNVLEWLAWKPFGGMPSQWVVLEGDNPILTAEQLQLLSAKLRSRLNVAVPAALVRRRPSGGRAFSLRP